jgi:hypothetical protein
LRRNSGLAAFGRTLGALPRSWLIRGSARRHPSVVRFRRRIRPLRRLALIFVAIPISHNVILSAQIHDLCTSSLGIDFLYQLVGLPYWERFCADNGREGVVLRQGVGSAKWGAWGK